MRLRRHPLPFWCLALALALVTALTVTRLLAQAADRAARLGGLRDAPVATRAVDAGQVLSSRDVAVRRLPAALLPSAPLASSPAGHVVIVPLAPGEVVLEAKLAPWGVRGVAALVPPGMRALAVPVDHGGLALRRGDRVDVLATFDTTGDDGGGAGAGGEAGGVDPTFAVSSGALVVDVADGAVTVAVAPDDAPRAAFAIARGTVTLALAGIDPGGERGWPPAAGGTRGGRRGAGAPPRR